MRFDSQKAFPYPVLRPFSDDYNTFDFQAVVEFEFLADEHVAELYLTFATSADAIKERIEADQAQVLAVVSCRETYFRKVVQCTHFEARAKFDPKLILKALGNLKPYVARDLRMWCYLTHMNLLSYSRSRWPIPTNDEDAVSHIRRHFFGEGNRGIERDNAVSRLWWMAYICSRAEGLDIDNALDAFLYRGDVRANIIERPTTSQNVQVLSAVLRELSDSLASDKTFHELRHAMKRINLKGGYVLLDALRKAMCVI